MTKRDYSKEEMIVEAVDLILKAAGVDHPFHDAVTDIIVKGFRDKNK